MHLVKGPTCNPGIGKKVEVGVPKFTGAKSREIQVKKIGPARVKGSRNRTLSPIRERGPLEKTELNKKGR